MRTRFDKAYYDRFYRNPQTRATTPAAVRRHATFITAYLEHLGLTPDSILDVGCGTGMLLNALQRQLPNASVTGVEVSDYLCRRYGWERGSAVDYAARTPFDLVICNDVLAYLDDAACVQALGNLRLLTGTALYLGVLTAEDVELCDANRTDPEQHLRPTSWYRGRLGRYFVNVGGGLHLKKPLPVPVWTLDRAR